MLLLCSSLFSKFCRLEILKLLNFSNCPFCIFSFICCYCSNCSSCDIDSALSVSLSCNILKAILTLLEVFLQHMFSSTLCLQQGGGSTVIAPFLQKLLWRHNVRFLSSTSFKFSSLSLSFHDQLSSRLCLLRWLLHSYASRKLA